MTKTQFVRAKRLSNDKLKCCHDKRTMVNQPKLFNLK